MNKRLILFALIIIMYTACSKKQGPAPAITLTGKWNMVADTSLPLLNDFYNPAYRGTPITIPHPSYFIFNVDGSGSTVANEDPDANVRHFDYTIKRDTIIELSFINEAINGVNYTAAKDSAIIIQLAAGKLTLGFYDNGYPVERAYFTK